MAIANGSQTLRGVFVNVALRDRGSERYIDVNKW